MRFTGQVRVPEVDHPGIPATIVVEDGLAEVLLDGESLGRWSLYDVHAARLVSSAFSISFDGEEITFIADEPVDFAYKGVEHMAGVWARYKAMTIPRRVVAVGRSRRGTVPSRIPELREAMLSNLRTAGSVSAQSTLAGPVRAPEHEPSSWSRRLDAYSSIPAPIKETDEPDEMALEAEEPSSDVIEQTSATEAGSSEAETVPLVDPDAGTPTELAGPPQPPRIRPGPGLIPRQVNRIAPVPSSLSDEPVDWDTAWEEPPVHEESYEEPPADADRMFLEEGAWDGEELSEDPAEVDEPVEEIAASVLSEETDEVDMPNDVVLDLGDLEAGQRVSEPAAVAVADYPHGGDEMLEPDLELLFAGAPGPEGERSGLLGAVRSAFARNRGGVHEHQFVEAPGGIGIVRQICAECGYISIGVSD